MTGLRLHNNLSHGVCRRTQISLFLLSTLASNRAASYRTRSLDELPVNVKKLLTSPQKNVCVCEIQGNSLVVQWLGLRASTAGGPGSIPSRGIKIPQATQPKKGKTKNQTIGRRNQDGSIWFIWKDIIA